MKTKARKKKVRVSKPKISSIWITGVVLNETTGELKHVQYEIKI